MNVESLPAIHARLSYLEQQMGNINQALQRLADDMHQLAVASAKREQDAEALARAFKRIEAIEANVQTLKDNIEAAAKASLQKELDAARAEEQAQDNRKAQIIAEVIRTALIVGASIGLYHFGVKLL
ncbi:MAG: hypothetical protein ACP5D5_09340 [Acidithiobacillus sp.]|uniref:hypothetical protein n=1 Tax=Acidithiobacillus sp. TaxID=1872118 RepID=UPI003CFFD3A4